MVNQMKDYTIKQFEQLLINNGYSRKKKNGGHRIYSNGSIRIATPSHSRNISGVTAKRIIKMYGLKEKK